MYNRDKFHESNSLLIDQTILSKGVFAEIENEERLAKLLDMKHIFTTSTSKTNYRTLDRKINERQAVLKKTKRQPAELPYSHQNREEEQTNSAKQGKEKQEP